VTVQPALSELPLTPAARSVDRLDDLGQSVVIGRYREDLPTDRPVGDGISLAPGTARRQGRLQICSTYRHRATSRLYATRAIRRELAKDRLPLTGRAPLASGYMVRDRTLLGLAVPFRTLVVDLMTV
jgi:hypothetical protein